MSLESGTRETSRNFTLLRQGFDWAQRENTRKKRLKTILMKFFDFTYKKTTRGFSLVESLVAISILMFAIGGTFFVTSRGITTARLTRDQVGAFYLAQEAIEFTKNKRDTNIIKELTWLDGISGCLSGVCAIDVTAEAGSQVTQCATHNDCSPLYLNQNGIFNQQGTGEKTIFTRSITLNEIVTDQEAEVTVTWNEQGREKTYSSRTNIFNTKR
jgi:type II secretory pathway pseudopilin PulG